MVFRDIVFIVHFWGPTKHHKTMSERGILGRCWIRLTVIWCEQALASFWCCFRFTSWIQLNVWFLRLSFVVGSIVVMNVSAFLQIFEGFSRVYHRFFSLCRRDSFLEMVSVLFRRPSGLLTHEADSCIIVEISLKMHNRWGTLCQWGLLLQLEPPQKNII